MYTRLEARLPYTACVRFVTEAGPAAIGAVIRLERVPDGAHDVPLSRVGGLRERLRQRAHLAREARGVRDVDPDAVLDIEALQPDVRPSGVAQDRADTVSIGHR